ncbi:hypothetical protein RND81_11G036800 [Saponaria officinalis]|uniref:PPM-type phosphatase domain-containing protein n=1 Tax=Saponaria officinalis TaxID=3572 RepID=A0AAW1HHP3_SAPOF
MTSSSDTDDTTSPPSSAGTLFSSSSGGGTTSSSGEFSLGSGDIPAAVTAAIDPTAYVDAVDAPAAREKCVGRQERVSWGWTSVIGRRSEMEEAVAVVSGFVSRTCSHAGGCTAPGSRMSGDVSPLHFFGVADFCAKKMHGVIADELNQEGIDEHEWQQKWQEAFCSGFRRADDEVMTDTVASEMVGSTAIVAVVSGCQIILSNCGDSRAVLCKRTQTIPLTVDHKPDRVDELSRIEGEGGRVINWYGARVLGVLAMSRAIGDRYMSPYIIPVPEVTFMTRSEEDECLILASDGLWDVMSNDEVGNTKVAGNKSPAQVVADNLTALAGRLNSSDNISIIVVDLKPRRRLKPSTEILSNPD